MSYRPLPDNVTIKKSPIEGLGLFATKDIEKGYYFGISHIEHASEENGYIRTPLGGFVNHSEGPNVQFIDAPGVKYMKALTNIKKGEELTAFYTLYTV